VVSVALVVLALLGLGLPAPAAAQAAPTVPLEQFVHQLARLWAAGNADAITELAPPSGRIVLDLGGDAGSTVQGRHASAALRSLFSARSTVSMRASRVTLSGQRQGFGEYRWAYRSRGMSSNQQVSVYFGVAWEEGAWRVREIRVRG
jgi:hypothetical protein